MNAVLAQAPLFRAGRAGRMDGVKAGRSVDSSASLGPGLEVRIDTGGSGCVVPRRRTDGVSCSASTGGNLIHPLTRVSESEEHG